MYYRDHACTTLRSLLTAQYRLCHGGRRVEILDERSAEERNEQGYAHALDLDSEDEAISGGAPTAQELTFDPADMSQSP